MLALHLLENCFLYESKIKNNKDALTGYTNSNNKTDNKIK